MAKIQEEVSSSELAVFKKKLKKLAEYRGRGTELISLYVPEDADRSTVMGQLTEEVSQSSNIKSPTTRKNVQGALRKIINFLKTINFKIPKKGIVVFSGNVSEVEGKTDIRLFTIRPVKNLRTRLYWCDSQFHLAPLKEMLQPNEIYALVTIDKNEATLAALVGKRYDIVGHFTSGVAGKTRAGGQSAKRFEHLREEAAQDFYKRVSEKVNGAFLQYGDMLKGVIIGGPGMTKNYFLEKDLIDHRIKKKIIGRIDTSYTDESGIRELVHKAENLLKDTDMMRERLLVNKFFEEVAKSDLAAYGQKEVEANLAVGKVSVLLLSEALEWTVKKTKCGNCGSETEFVVKNKEDEKKIPSRCGKCSGGIEIIEEIDYIDYLLEKAQSIGAELKVISTETSEGEQFMRAFGGIGAILRYK